ncbi:MAG: hypothetical protein EOM37_14885 [Proteobacteria bacterium]|jgi:hypothetical protein|nr:hypothetical protein [Pseudomonadota bacterium]
MSAYSREPENLEERIARTEHHEREIQAKRQREAEGARQRAERHSRHTGLSIRRDGLPGRHKTDSNYRLFEN